MVKISGITRSKKSNSKIEELQLNDKLKNNKTLETLGIRYLMLILKLRAECLCEISRR